MADQLDSPEDIYSDSQDVESGIKFQTNLNHNHVFRFTKEYFPMGDTEFLWIRGRNMGKRVSEYGYYQSHASPEIEVTGEPLLVDGSPFDHGVYDESVGVKSLALDFNRASVEAKGLDTECIRVADFYGIDLDNGTGFSIFVRFSARSLSQNNGNDVRLFAKVDDNIPVDAYQAILRSDGKVRWQVKRSGTERTWDTAAGTIQTNKIYGAWFTWKQSDQTMHVWIENETDQIAPVDKTLSAVTGNAWMDDPTNHDLWIFTKGAGSGGQLKGKLWDFKFYNTLVASSTQIANHWENKLSISDILFGHVMITNHWATQIATAFSTSSYTGSSFTSGSFTM